MVQKAIQFGVGLFPTESANRMVELTKLAEDTGYGCAYIGDSQMIWRETYIILGAAAMVTSRITLATGVTNPVTRDPAVLASAWATLHEMTGGRTLLGIGTGDSSLETLSKKPAKLAELERSMRLIRDLVSGRHSTHPDSGADIHITFSKEGTHIPQYPAVSSPNIHRLAGRVGDGAIVLVGTDPGFLRASRQEIEAGAAEAGRDLAAEGFRTVCWAPCAINEDGKAARAAVKAHVSRILKRKLPFELDEETMEVVRRIREQYEYYEHMVPGTAHGEVVPDSLVEKFAVAGTPTEVQEQLERLTATGIVDEIAIIPHTQVPAEREHTIRLVGEMIPRLQGVGAAR